MWRGVWFGPEHRYRKSGWQSGSALSPVLESLPPSCLERAFAVGGDQPDSPYDASSSSGSPE